VGTNVPTDTIAETENEMLARELPLAPLTDRTLPFEPLRVADSPDAHRMHPRRIAARGFPLRELPRPAPQPTTGPLAPATFEGMVGETPVMLQLFGFIRRLAPYPTTALITGESGTGKELVARAIHRLSPRNGRPLVVCNCTTLTPTLVETELFGHVRGAFTGADRDHKGLFEAADGSTIFLDEIGDLPLAAQVKLLRVLEEYEIRRVGSSEPTRVDVRVVAATNRDLTEMVATGAFRTDLYFRLNVGAIHLAPLRERPDDLDALVRHFLVRWNQRLGRRVSGISAQAFATLRQHSWPGNVRELGNVIERAMVASDGNLILPDHLPPLLGARTSTASAAPPAFTLESAERDQILRALEAAGGRRTAAARLLGLSRRTLYRKLDRHGIP
jgi:transcriptional regulator with PAS, ATPase and Fis domain